nr:zinc finger, CCHC-type [Tanacetum cinerariifolium]
MARQTEANECMKNPVVELENRINQGLRNRQAIIENLVRQFEYLEKIQCSESLRRTINTKPRHEIIYKPSLIQNENDKGDVKAIKEDETKPIPTMPNLNPMKSNSPTISPFLKDCTMHIAIGKEAEWLRNLILEIPLWSKPIAPISIRCDSAATLAKSYSQMYNVKSRHLRVRHSMIRKLIMNGMIYIEFVRSQQNLANHLTKGLARDLVINSAEGMGLIGLKHMYLHIILRMCLLPGEKEDEVFTSQWYSDGLKGLVLRTP